MSLRATSLPDPGDPGIVTLAGAISSFAFAVFEAGRRRSIERIKDAAFLGGLAGVGLGLLIYVFVVILS